MSRISLSSNHFAYAMFGVLLLLEYVFFCRFAEREIVWAYPNNHDQLGYLFSTYKIYTDFLEVGRAAWAAYLSNPPPQGILFPIHGFILCLLFGATRLTCLGVNFIFFGVLQGFLIYTLRWLTGNIWVGFIGVGLVLSQISAFGFAGGMFDYRIDFTAYCLYGIWILTVVRSRVFEDARWTIIAALVATWLMLTRFITVPYIVGTTALTALLIILAAGRSLFRTAECQEVLARITNAGLFLAIGAVLMAPFLYVAGDAIWDYYGQLHESEKHVRAAELLITDLYGHLTYCPKSILSDHLGRRFLILSLTLLCLAYVLRRIGLGYPAEPGSDPCRPMPSLSFLIAAIVAPLLILTLHNTKSQTSGGIVGIPVALVVLLAVLRASGGARICTSAAFSSPRVWVVLAAISIVGGSANYFSHLTEHWPFQNRRAEVANLMEIYDAIGKYVESVGWTREPTCVVNLISDAMNPLAISICYFERRGVLIPMKGLLGRSILAVEKDEVFKQLRHTDILILGDTSKRFALSEYYPIHHTLTPLSDEMERWAKKALVGLVSTPSVEGRGYTVYVRPGLRVTGLTDKSCIPAEGVWITGDSRVIRQRPLWVVEGTSAQGAERAVTITAALYRRNMFSMPISIDLRHQGNSFAITLDFREVAFGQEGETWVNLRPVSKSDPSGESLPSTGQSSCHYCWGTIRMERAALESRSSAQR